MAELIKHSDAVVSVDNGAMHLADIMGKKTIALFGSTDPAIVGPVSEDSAVLGPMGDCTLCGKNRCSRAVQSCLEEISAEDVMRLLI